MPSPPPEEQEEVARSASAINLFAYPASRRLPWATLFLLSLGASTSAAAAMLWNFRVCSAQSVEELQSELSSFTAVIGACSVSHEDVKCGRVHRLLLASWLHAGEQPARTVADAAILGLCGTLLERLYGSTFLLSLALAGTALGNFIGLEMHEALLRGTTGECQGSLSSTSAGVAAVGCFTALVHSRWAVWPGVPFPASWLMAPLLVSDLSASLGYFQQLKEYRVQTEAEATKGETDPAEKVLSRLDVGVGLAACEAALARARSNCSPPPEDILAWNQQLKIRAEDQTLPPPDPAWMADLAAAAFALGVAALVRVRR